MTSGLTLVVLTKSEIGSDVAKVLQEWSAEGLLHDMLVIGVPEEEAAAEPARCQLISQGVVNDSEILEVVAARDVSLLRLIRLRVVDGPVGPDPATELLAQRLEARIAGLHQDLLRVNVVVPVRDDMLVPVEALRPLWKANVIVSPEDRLTERHVAAKVETRLAAHAALAVTTAGALWSQMTEGPFDRPIAEQGSSPQSALIARSWARVLVGGGALRQVVHQVFAIRKTQPDAVARAAGGVVARDPSLVVGRATAAFLEKAEDGALNYRSAEPLPPPVAITVGLLTSLKMMFSFLWAGMRSLPGLVRDSAARAVQGHLENAVQSLTFGRDSAVSTSFSGRQGAAVPAEQAADPSLAVRQFAQSVLAAMELPEVPAATPAAWRDLRMTVFGLHDGGPLPPYIEAPVAGGVREIVTDLPRLAAVPLDAPVRLAAHVSAEDAAEEPMKVALRECDPFQAQATRTWLEQRLQQLPAPGPQAEVAGTDVDTSASPAAERRTRLERALSVLDDWIVRRQPTPCWRVAEHLMQQMQVAASRLETSMTVLRQYAEQDDDADQSKALKRLKLWWYVILGAAVLLVLWWWASQRLSESDIAFLQTIGDRGLSLGWRILVATVLAWLIASFLVFLRYQREMFRLAHRHNRRVHEFRVASRDAQHDSREVIRLASSYEQARDWGAVIAWMLHRPEGPADRSSGDDRLPAELVTPLALTRAAGKATAPSLQRVASQVANDRFQRSWLSDLYLSHVDSTMGTLAHERGLDAGSVRFDPDSDVVDPKRQYLADAVRRGVPASAWRATVTTSARNHLARTNPEDLFPEVVHLDDSQPGKVVPARQFLDDVGPSNGAVEGALPLLATFWSRSAINNARHRTTAVHVWLPEAARRSAQGGGLTTHPLEVGPRDDDSFMLQAIRVDLAGPVSWQDVATSPEPLQSVPSADLPISEGGAL